MKTEKIKGFFDVRQYNERLPKEQWKLVPDGENIAAVCVFEAGKVPEDLQGYAKGYVSKQAREQGSTTPDRMSVRFKIGRSCRFFNKYGEEVARPTHAELDGGSFYLKMDYRFIEPKPEQPKSPSGLWVNALMYEKEDTNPFAGEAFASREADGQDPEPEEETRLPFDE